MQKIPLKVSVESGWQPSVVAHVWNPKNPEVEAGVFKASVNLSDMCDMSQCSPKEHNETKRKCQIATFGYGHGAIAHLWPWCNWYKLLRWLWKVVWYCQQMLNVCIVSFPLTSLNCGRWLNISSSWEKFWEDSSSLYSYSLVLTSFSYIIYMRDNCGSKLFLLTYRADENLFKSLLPVSQPRPELGAFSSSYFPQYLRVSII